MIRLLSGWRLFEKTLQVHLHVCLLRRLDTRLTHSPFVVFFRIRIEGTLLALFVLTMGRLTKVRVVLHRYAANVATLGATAAGHLVTAGVFEKRLFAFRARSNLGTGDSFFDRNSTIRLLFLFDLVTPKTGEKAK
jgi:hypothetical protein